MHRIARLMVTQFGMSRLGRVYYQDGQESPFLSGSGWSDKDYSQQTAREIDLEVKKIIDDNLAEVQEVLFYRKETLIALAERLVEKETIDGAEVRALMAEHNPGPKLVPGSLPINPPGTKPAASSDSRAADSGS